MKILKKIKNMIRGIHTWVRNWKRKLMSSQGAALLHLFKETVF